jgi:tRNA(fMet)-specific endonuclease VapC
MRETLIDTDILSDIMRGQQQSVVAAADLYLQTYNRFQISAFTQYEVIRGLRWRGATGKLARFALLCEAMTVHAVTWEVLDQAARLWADAAQRGKSKMDADLMIAATAMVHQLTLATGNVAHFDWIRGLDVIDWRK